MTATNGGTRAEPERGPGSEDLKRSTSNSRPDYIYDIDNSFK